MIIGNEWFFYDYIQLFQPEFTFWGTKSHILLQGRLFWNQGRFTKVDLNAKNSWKCAKGSVLGVKPKENAHLKKIRTDKNSRKSCTSNVGSHAVLNTQFSNKKIIKKPPSRLFFRKKDAHQFV